MSYVVSARKYRPQKFDEVVGQQAVTRILQKAIEQNRLAQALLFTGPRGVGKTTCARIMAKEVNKAYLDNPDQDLSFNIFELDAASNNSVDDIRELTEQVRIPPHVGKYKVYIIDEVHMLSTSAFNAFLKTLEEPPEHAIFILATTEKHKIPATILSRCQIFDFKRINTEDIQKHLKKIASLEGIQADDDALMLIARSADGALRDALSAFDKIISLGNEHITRQLVAEYLGILDYDIYFEITGKILEGDEKDLILYFNELVDKGIDIHHFIGGLSTHLRDLLMAQNPATLPLVETGEEIRKRYAGHAQEFNAENLIQAIDLSLETDIQYKSSQNPRLLTEILLFKLTDLLSKKKNPATKSTPEPDLKKTETATAIHEQSGEYKPQTSNASVKTTETSPQTVSNPTPKSGAGLSINNILETARKTKRIKRDQPFSPEDFQNAFQSFLEILKQNQEKSKLTVLQQAQPQVNGNEIVFTFDSLITENEFNQLSNRLLKFLQDQLQNDFIKFKTKRIKTRKQENLPVRFLTDKEKLELIIKDNQAVRDFVTKLNLFFK